jgi:PKD repeat protein
MPSNTGIAANATLPCAPQANYSVNQSVICAGSTVQFTDRSTFGNPTSWQWNFPGGSPNSSTDENPTVTYHYKGNFNVSLTVTNGNGT